ncbi:MULTISPECIES: hypothetical protein [Aquimarina]|uniref:hypothetical protein n=1 Tax=Aquimarina TaxID=290174 RepID=UPI000ADBF63D|nr:MULTISPECIES: hypothetical protein [Aquimarina]
MPINFNYFFKPGLYGFTTKRIISLCIVILFLCFPNQSSCVLASSPVVKFNTSNINPIALKEFQPLAVAIETAKLNTCKIEITSFTGESITVAFSGLPANQPSTYKNFIAIWESSVIPWTVEPLKMIEIGVNTQSGTVTIDGLTITYNSYVVGYGVGSGTGNICASAILGAGGIKAPLSNVHIGIENLGQTSLSVFYQTLSGYLPKKNGNWVGLWKGYASPYNLPPDALIKTKIDSYSNQGIVALNNLSLGRDTEYTLIYFMGADNTTAAAILNFNTSDPASDK